MGIRIPAQVSKADNPAATSTQSSRPRNLQKPVLNMLGDQNSDDNYSDVDNEIMAMAEEEEEEEGAGGNEEEEEKESSQEENEEDEDEPEPPKVPQKRKNIAAGHGSKST
jgi:hypothetical protein